MSEVFSFPFVQPWMSQAADAANSEPPALRLVRNGRFRRLGQVAKRSGLTTANQNVATNSPALEGMPMLIGDFNGRQVLVAGDGLLYARSNDSVSWTAQDRIPTFVPSRAQELPRDDVDGPPKSPSIAATTFGDVLVGWNNGNDTVLGLYDSSGTKRWAETLPGEFEPKIITAAFLTMLVVITRSGTTLNARIFDTNALTLGAPTAIGTLNATTDNWDANGYSSSYFALAYRDGATQARVELWRFSNLTLFASAAFTINNQRIMPAVWGQDPENIYVAWWDPQATRSVKARVCNASLALTSGGTVTLGDSVGFAVKPVIARRNATSAHIIWGGNSTSGDEVTRHRTLTNAGVLGANTSEIRNVHVVSEPFVSTEETVTLWVRQANAAFVRCRYVLVTLRLDSFGLMQAQPELHTDAGWVPHVQTFEDEPSAQTALLGNGDWATVVLRRIRGELGSSAVNNVGVVMLRFRGAYTARDAQRSGIDAQRVYHVTGGQLIEHMGSAYDESLDGDLFSGVENNFLQPPVIENATAVAGGSLTSGATYQYCCVFEGLDPAGRRSRSLPSNIATVSPSGGNLTGSLVVTTCGVTGRKQKDSWLPVAMHIYRTTGNGSIFYRVSSDVTAPNALANSAQQTVTDALGDSSINTRETLYVQREAGNYPCPSHRFAVQGGGRMFVGGLWDETLIACSKPFVPDEPVQFVEDNAFRILSPVPVTALGWLDGALVIFGERSIYVVSGDGPDRQGNGAFRTPQRIPGDVGCTDWRTVREVPQGLLFQSSRGFHLLPRGFGAPVFQADIQDVLGDGYYVCFGAARHEERRPGESTLSYLLARGDSPAQGENLLLTYNLDSGKWVSVDAFNEEDPYVCIGSWQGQVALAASTIEGTVENLVYAFGATEPGRHVETHVLTGQFHPFGFGGFGRVQEVVVHGEYRAIAWLGIRLKVDGHVTHELTPSASTRINAVNGVSLSQGDKFYFRWRPPRCQGNTFEVEVWDAEDTGIGSPSEGLWFNGISMLVDPEEGNKPLGSGNRG